MKHHYSKIGVGGNSKSTKISKKASDISLLNYGSDWVMPKIGLILRMADVRGKEFISVVPS